MKPPENSDSARAATPAESEPTTYRMNDKRGSTTMIAHNTDDQGDAARDFPHHIIDESTVNTSRFGFAPGWFGIESLAHTVGGYFLELVGQVDVDPDGELLDPRIVLKPWVKHSYFGEIGDLRPITTREARQLAHVLLALAEEVDGWSEPRR